MALLHEHDVNRWARKQYARFAKPNPLWVAAQIAAQTETASKPSGVKARSELKKEMQLDPQAGVIIRTPMEDPEQPDYDNGATHQDHAKARALGGSDDADNKRPLPAETNMRKGGYEGQLKQEKLDLMNRGLTEEQADAAIADEITSMANSPPPRPMDPDVIRIIEEGGFEE
jgi:hypothetical protein